MNLLRTLPLLLLTALAPSLRASELPLRAGEQLIYRVSWAVFSGAGEIKIDATPAANPGQLSIVTTTVTRGVAKAFMYFKADAESLFDLKTGKLLSMHENSTTRSKVAVHSTTFDYDKREATYKKTTPAEQPRVLPIPAGDPVDLIIALLQTRSWNLKPGEKQDALVLFDDDFYELTIHAARYEQITSKLGTFNTLVLEPRMDKTPPKGMFKRGSTVRVWIAQDERRLPVQFQVEFKIGTGTARLESYRPPAAAAPDAKNPRP
ncbi:MAG: DUF3108 domain-containing protein [Verrucomicrobiota bacterium]